MSGDFVSDGSLLKQRSHVVTCGSNLWLAVCSQVVLAVWHASNRTCRTCSSLSIRAASHPVSVNRMWIMRRAGGVGRGFLYTRRGSACRIWSRARRRVACSGFVKVTQRDCVYEMRKYTFRKWCSWCVQMSRRDTPRRRYYQDQKCKGCKIDIMHRENVRK